MRHVVKGVLAAVRLWMFNHLVSRIPLGCMRDALYRRAFRIRLGVNAHILTECRFAKAGNLVLGDGSVINNHCFIDNRGSVFIGRNSSISVGTMILTMGHAINSRNFETTLNDVSIGDHVWICARCIIQPGVTIGDGAVVLPGSVVTHDVAPYCVVGGLPARKIGERSRDLDYTLNWSPLVPSFG